MSALDTVRLEELVSQIETGLERGQRSFTIARELQKNHSAFFKWKGSAEILQMAGVTASCTWGQDGLLTNWCAAARRKIAKVSS